MAMRIPPILLVFSLLCTTANAEENAKYSDAAAEKAGVLQANIKEELSSLDAGHWAGSYYYGDGLGSNVSLHIAPKTGFVFELHGCLGLYDRNYGSAEEKNHKIHLTFDFENKQGASQGFSPSFIPLKWGERRYLIPADEVIKFVNAINFGSEPRSGIHGSFLLREGDHNKKAEGLPSLPEKYLPYLLSQPIKAEVVKIRETSVRGEDEDWRTTHTVVFLDVGKKNGVLQGMEFHVHQPGDVFVLYATVRQVNEDSSEVEIVQLEEDDLADSLPKVGWKLSTAIEMER